MGGGAEAAGSGAMPGSGPLMQDLDELLERKVVLRSQLAAVAHSAQRSLGQLRELLQAHEARVAVLHAADAELAGDVQQLSQAKQQAGSMDGAALQALLAAVQDDSHALAALSLPPLPGPGQLRSPPRAPPPIGSRAAQPGGAPLARGGTVPAAMLEDAGAKHRANGAPPAGAPPGGPGAPSAAPSAGAPSAASPSAAAAAAPPLGLPPALFPVPAEPPACAMLPAAPGGDAPAGPHGRDAPPADALHAGAPCERTLTWGEAGHGAQPWGMQTPPGENTQFAGSESAPAGSSSSSSSSSGSGAASSGGRGGAHCSIHKGEVDSGSRRAAANQSGMSGGAGGGGGGGGAWGAAPPAPGATSSHSGAGVASWGVGPPARGAAFSRAGAGVASLPAGGAGGAFGAVDDFPTLGSRGGGAGGGKGSAGGGGAWGAARGAGGGGGRSSGNNGGAGDFPTLGSSSGGGGGGGTGATGSGGGGGWGRGVRMADRLRQQHGGSTSALPQGHAAGPQAAQPARVAVPHTPAAAGGGTAVPQAELPARALALAAPPTAPEDVVRWELRCGLRVPGDTASDMERRRQMQSTREFESWEEVRGRRVNVAEGLELHAGLLSPAEQDVIIQKIASWANMGFSGELRGRTFSAPSRHMKGKGRRTMQFGCCYNYATDAQGRGKGIIPEKVVEPMPPELVALTARLVRWRVLPASLRPDSAIINIYDKDDCIPPHIDHHDFLRPFCTISLCSTQPIVFAARIVPNGPGVFVPSKDFAVHPPPGSVLVLKGNGADVAMHCVPPVSRRRVSITLRRMRPEHAREVQRWARDVDGA